MKPFIFRRRVEFCETDMAGIVHFTAFFRYMEAAEHELLRSVGIGIEYHDGDRTLGWPRVSCAFDFKAPLRFGDVAEVHIGLSGMGARSLTYTADIFCDERLVASGRSTCACCQVFGKTVRTVDIPAAVRAALAPFVNEPNEGRGA
jgi:acyl-CoA thioester hydrolase